jgi:cysteine desulfurase
LVLRRDLAAVPFLHGGGQERGVRSGTLATALIVGCGVAVALAASEGPAEALRLRALRDQLRNAVLAVDGVQPTVATAAISPHHLHVAVAGCDGEALLLALDRAGVACSTGSACQSGAAQPSHVLTAIRVATERTAHLRFTLGRTTSEVDVTAAGAHFAAAVDALRGAGGGFA